MPSYVITGASRGLGYAFLQHLSADPSNIVIGLVRNKSEADAKVKKDGLPKNVHILQADILDIPALKKAAEDTTKITGGDIDILINNAAYQAEGSAFAGMQEAEKDLPTLSAEFTKTFQVNTLGVLYTTTAFLPLIRAGQQKKAIAITSGMADIDLINRFSIAAATPYTASKAALNVLVAKYNAAYGATEGILFLGISPGVVATSRAESLKDTSGEEVERFQAMLTKFQEYAPHFKGPITPAESVDAVLKVIDGASVEGGWGGKFVSHFGNTQWL